MTAVCVLSHRWLRLLTATRHAEPDPWWTATLTTFAGLKMPGREPMTSEPSRTRSSSAAI
jgi:hypothetical protein